MIASEYILRDGITDYFTKIVWSNINVNNVNLRKTIEGSFHDSSNPLGHKLPPFGVYEEAKNAERLATIVGFKNMCASYFLGKVELIGKV